MFSLILFGLWIRCIYQVLPIKMYMYHLPCLIPYSSSVIKSAYICIFTDVPVGALWTWLNQTLQTITMITYLLSAHNYAQSRYILYVSVKVKSLQFSGSRWLLSDILVHFLLISAGKKATLVWCDCHISEEISNLKNRV